MTTLYNGNLYIKGLTLVDGAVQGSTTSDIILSMLDTIPYVSTQRVMMEIGGFNRTVGNYGNIHKYLLGYSNSSSGTGGSFIIQGVPVATNTYNSTDAPITFLTISPNGNITTSESLTINTITTPFRLSQSGTTYGTVSAYGATPTCRIEAGPNTFNGNGGVYVSANNLSIAGQGLTWGGGGMGKPAEIVLEGGRSRFGALNSSNNIFFYTSGTERARFSENGLSVNGNLSVGGTLSLATNRWHTSTEGVERLFFESSGTSYYNSPTAHFFRVNQTDKLTVTNTGITATGATINGTLSVATGTWHKSTENIQRLFFESSNNSYYNSPTQHVFRINQTDQLTITKDGINITGDNLIYFDIYVSPNEFGDSGNSSWNYNKHNIVLYKPGTYHIELANVLAGPGASWIGRVNIIEINGVYYARSLGGAGTWTLMLFSFYDNAIKSAIFVNNPGSSTGMTIPKQKVLDTINYPVSATPLTNASTNKKNGFIIGLDHNYGGWWSSPLIFMINKIA